MRFNHVDLLGFHLGRWYQRGRFQRNYQGNDGEFIYYRTKTDLRRHMMHAIRIDLVKEWFDGADLLDEVNGKAVSR